MKKIKDDLLRLAITIVLASGAQPSEACEVKPLPGKRQLAVKNSVAADVLTTRGLSIEQVTSLEFLNLQLSKGFGGNCEAAVLSGTLSIRYNSGACQGRYKIWSVSESDLEQLHLLETSESCQE